MFPNTTLGDGTTFLPAAGWRNPESGIATDQLAGGWYWTSEADSKGAFYIRSTATVSNPLANSGENQYGFSVRCVRQ